MASGLAPGQIGVGDSSGGRLARGMRHQPDPGRAPASPFSRVGFHTKDSIAAPAEARRRQASGRGVAVGGIDSAKPTVFDAPLLHHIRAGTRTRFKK